ncbi:hypothetical protein BU198_02230, partial [Streptomyces sp. CBMA156]|nr:hypothetical protein [Streptomyces sp. CBMA156]
MLMALAAALLVLGATAVVLTRSTGTPAAAPATQARIAPPAEQAPPAAPADALTPPPAPAPGREPLLKVTGLTRHFPIRSGLLRRQTGAVRAVDGID